MITLNSELQGIKPMPSFWERLRFAWRAFMLKDCTLELPFQDSEPAPDWIIKEECDNNDIWRICKTGKPATSALYKLTATIHVSYRDCVEALAMVGNLKNKS